jgi:hypothetical protein
MLEGVRSARVVESFGGDEEVGVGLSGRQGCHSRTLRMPPVILTMGAR